MDNYFGNQGSPVWFMGDSPPEKWKDRLLYPLDPKHPTRHSIWTPIENYCQRRLYEKAALRLDTDKFFIMNAVENASEKPAKREDWGALEGRIGVLKKQMAKYRPVVVLTFGSFAFELLRRVTDEEPQSIRQWGCREMGEEFVRRLDAWRGEKTNILPLLHVTISRGKFLDAHRLYCGESGYKNYFEYVGEKISELFMEKLAAHDLWSERRT
jgi:hypothetical protein